MRKALTVLALVCCCSTTSALAQVSFAFDSPGVSIAVNVPVYPDLVRIPGYPVYYAPQLPANYFFYDGLYWVFVNGDWYASPWYNGPWQVVAVDAVPLFLLRVPVRYYRAPSAFFRGWAVSAPPRWGEHWGSRWEESHRGWDRWNRSAVPAPAPLPTYQRSYSGNRYPTSLKQQQTLESRNYHYQPRDRFAAQHAQRGAPVQSAQAPRPNTQTNAAAERSRNEAASREAGRTTRSAPAVAQQATPPVERTQPAATAQRRAPATEQRAAAPRPEQRATAPQAQQRAAAPRQEQHAAAPRQEQRANAPQPEQRAATPQPQQHAAVPRQEQRAAAPRPEQRAATPSERGHPQTAKGSQPRGPEAKGQAQAPHDGNDNAHAGERRNENNG